MTFVFGALLGLNLLQFYESFRFLRKCIELDARAVKLMDDLLAERDRLGAAMREIASLECDLSLKDGQGCGYCGRCEAREMALEALGASS